MSIQDVQDVQSLTNQYMTRLAFAKEYKIPYTIVTDRVRRGEIALHFVDERVMINVAEALKACERKPRNSRAKVVTLSLFD
jgi:hypothetical protein